MLRTLLTRSYIPPKHLRCTFNIARCTQHVHCYHALDQHDISLSCILSAFSKHPPPVTMHKLSMTTRCHACTQHFNVITFIASLLRGTTQGNMTSQRERTVAEMTHAQPWLPSPTADPHSRDCYMNISYSMHNTQSRLPVNDNDVITLGATIGTFEAVVFFSNNTDKHPPVTMHNVHMTTSSQLVSMPTLSIFQTALTNIISQQVQGCPSPSHILLRAIHHLPI